MIAYFKMKKQTLFAIFSGINKHILTNTVYKVNTEPSELFKHIKYIDFLFKKHQSCCSYKDQNIVNKVHYIIYQLA